MKTTHAAKEPLPRKDTENTKTGNSNSIFYVVIGIFRGQRPFGWFPPSLEFRRDKSAFAKRDKGPHIFKEQGRKRPTMAYYHCLLGLQDTFTNTLLVAKKHIHLRRGYGGLEKLKKGPEFGSWAAGKELGQTSRMENTKEYGRHGHYCIGGMEKYDNTIN